MQYFHAPSSVELIGAVQRAELDTVKSILNNSLDCIAASDEKGYTAMHWAAYIDDVRILNVLIDASKESLWTALTHKGQTVLHIACSNSSLGSVQRIVELLSAGGTSDYINRQNKFQETALHVAAGTNRVDIVQLLLEPGHADPYLLDQWQRTPRKVALENGYIWTAAAIALSYDGSYDRSLDEPRHEVPALAANARTNTQQLLSAELQRKLKTQSNTDESGESGRYGLSKAVTEEKHMFAPAQRHSATEPEKDLALPQRPNPLACAANVASEVAPLPAKPKTALSKLVEFPGDPVRVAELLEDDSVALNGKDMYGITALMKFAAWNKVELLGMLLPRLTTEEVNATGGRQKLPLLHYCVDMDAYAALRVLLEDGRADPTAKDEHGRDYRQHAEHLGKILPPL